MRILVGYAMYRLRDRWLVAALSRDVPDLGIRPESTKSNELFWFWIHLRITLPRYFVHVPLCVHFIGNQLLLALFREGVVIHISHATRSLRRKGRFVILHLRELVAHARVIVHYREECALVPEEGLSGPYWGPCLGFSFLGGSVGAWNVGLATV